MAESRNGWTRPGAIEPAGARGDAADPVLKAADAEEARKGTAGANPVVVVPAPPRDTRTPAQIEADLDRTRERLSETLDALSERLSPRDLARRGGRRVKARFVDEQTGRPRPRAAAAVLGGVGGALAALALLRRGRGRSS
jgi:hypothetical protein